METAKAIIETFFEIVAAPSYADGVVEFFREKKPNLRVLTITPGYAPNLQLTKPLAILSRRTAPATSKEDEGKWISKAKYDFGMTLSSHGRPLQ